MFKGLPRRGLNVPIAGVGGAGVDAPLTVQLFGNATHNGVSTVYDSEEQTITIVNLDKGSVARAAHEVASNPHPQYLTPAEAASAYTPAAHVGSSGGAHAPASTTVDGFMSAADKTKLNGLPTSAAALGSSPGAALSSVASAGASATAARSDHIHPYPTAAQVGAASVSNLTPANLGFSASAGVQSTASRADHVHPLPTAAQVGAASTSHTHSSSAISDFNEAAQDAAAGLFAAGSHSGISFSYSDGGNAISATVTGGSAGAIYSGARSSPASVPFSGSITNVSVSVPAGIYFISATVTVAGTAPLPFVTELFAGATLISGGSAVVAVSNTATTVTLGGAIQLFSGSVISTLVRAGVPNASLPASHTTNTSVTANSVNTIYAIRVA